MSELTFLIDTTNGVMLLEHSHLCADVLGEVTAIVGEGEEFGFSRPIIWIDFEHKKILVIKGRRKTAALCSNKCDNRDRCERNDHGLPPSVPGQRIPKAFAHRDSRRMHQQEKGGTREENYHFHDLRSCFASERINRNTNPLIVQNMFDQSDMSTTTDMLARGAVDTNEGSRASDEGRLDLTDIAGLLYIVHE